MIATNIDKKLKRKRIRHSIVTTLAAIVVFVTTYALIIPAITWEKTLICPLEEHIHTDVCYSSKGELKCGKDEHKHTDACFDAPKTSIKEFYCNKCEHSHTDECYFADGLLRCTIPEHSHSVECRSNKKADGESSKKSIITESVRTIESTPSSDGAIAIVTGNLPDDAVVEIDAVALSGKELAAYVGEKQAALMKNYVAYDIKIMVGGAEWQPDETVGVLIRHPDIQVSDNQILEVAHIDSTTNEVSLVSSELDENGDVSIKADGFSYYIVYTVDFYYSELTFSIAGESEILLSDLFASLNIEKNVPDVTDVQFTNYELVEVEAVYAEDGIMIVDWKLISLKAFRTEEKLTATFADGEVLEIKVTDAQGDPVWAYHSTDLTTPYAQYATVRLAVTNVAFKDGDILEFHGDVVETASATLSIPKSVSIISESGYTHRWSFPSIAVNIYGIYINTANKTVTIGGGTGDGELVIDNSGNGGFANVRSGSLVIENRVKIQNCSGANGGAILVNKGTATVTPKLYINGGEFINNKAENGGAISNIYGITYLNGGSFEGNKAITAAASGNGNAIYQNSELHISGTPVFSDDQDIYLACTNDANHMSYDDHAIIKDSSIGCDSIPVTLGTSISALYEGRNVLRSGTADVTPPDAEIFEVLNEEDLHTYYKKTGYTAKDGETGNPVVELVPDFVGNMDNFIDDDYEVPTNPAQARTKTAQWLDAEKSQAEIVINEDSSKVEGPILVIGPLCGAHALNGNTIAAVINNLAQYNDVEYYFQSATAASKNMFDQGIAGTIRGPVSGTVNRYGSISGNVFGSNGNLYSGAHNSGGYMATKLQTVLQQKQYSNIVLFFDNFCITSYSYYAFTPAEQIAFYQTANLLKPYYDNNQVLWISSASHVVGVDYETQESVTEEVLTDLLGRGCYSNNENYYHYDETHTANNAASIAKFDKFNNFFNMALFDPATWLTGVWSGRIPAWEEYDVDNPGVLYAQASQITDYIDAWVRRDEMRITDTVDPELPINHAIIEVSYDNGNTWIDITENSGVSVDINGQDVVCTITDDDYFYTNLRMRIICDCPGEFKTEQDEPKDTNVGEATIDYYYHDVLNESHPLVSPKLYKAFPPTPVTVTKQFVGLTADQIAALADDFCINITKEGTDEIAARLSLLAEPAEGLTAPKSVSEDGTTYNWEISIPEGVYNVSESGADLSGYIRTSEGLGTITVTASESGGGNSGSQSGSTQGTSGVRGQLWDYTAASLEEAGISIVSISSVRDPVVAELNAWIPAISANAPSGWYTYCTKTGTDGGKIRLQNGDEYYLYVSCPNYGFAVDDKYHSKLPSFWPCAGYLQTIYEPKNIVVAWLEDASGNIAKLDNVIVGNEGTSSTFLWQFGGGSEKTIYTNGTLSYDKLAGPAALNNTIHYDWGMYGTRVTVQDQGIIQGIRSDADGYYTLWMTPFFVDDVAFSGDTSVYAHRGVDEVGVFEVSIPPQSDINLINTYSHNEYQRPVTVTKQFNGLNLERIAALADDFCIAITNADTEETVARLSLSVDPGDGLIAPAGFSEDGMNYTWIISIPDGVYIVSESGADLSGYTRVTDGLGTITVNSSEFGSGDVPIGSQYNAMERADEARGELWDYSESTLGESGIEVICVDNIRDAVEAKLVEGWQPASSANAPAGWTTFCTQTGSYNGMIKLSNGEEYYLYIACQYRDFANGARAYESSLPCVIPCEEGAFYLDFTQRCIVVAWFEDGSGNKVILDNVCVGNEGASTLFLWQFGGGSPKRIYTNDVLDYNAFPLDMSAYGWSNGNHATRVTHTDQHRFQGIKPDAEGYYTLWLTPFYNDGNGVALPLSVGVDEIAVFEINDASVTVAKQVVGNDEETGSFGFTIQYTDPAENVMEETFNLADGEYATFYVKPGTDVTITETETDAYVEAFKVTDDAVDYTEGCIAEMHNVTGHMQITFKNVYEEGISVDITNNYLSGCQLPETGGIGKNSFYLIGALLMLGALTIGHILWRRREGRGEV